MSPYPDPRLLEDQESPLKLQGGTLPISATSSNPQQANIDKLTKQSQNPLYRFGSALAGTDPVGKQLIQQQQLLMQQQQMAQQNQALQFQGLNAVINALDKFSGMDDETKKALVPVLGPFLQQLMPSVTGGKDIPTAALEAMATIPGIAKSAYAAFTDKSFTPEEKTLHEAAIRKLKNPNDVATYVQKIQADKVSDLQAQMSTQADQFVNQVRQAQGIPAGGTVRAEDVMNLVKQQSAYKESSFVRKAVHDMFGGKDAETILPSLGVEAPSSARKRMEAEVAPPPKPRTLEQVLGTGGGAEYAMRDPKFTAAVEAMQTQLGKAVSPDESVWLSIPPAERQGILVRAKAAQIVDAGKQGGLVEAAKTVAEARVKRELPVYQGLPTGKHVIDTHTWQEDPFVTGNEVEANKKKFKIIDTKSLDTIKAANETQIYLGEFAQVAKELTKQPGANLAQALSFWGQRKLGVAGTAVALETLNGTILRFAKAMQGSAQGISENDRKSVEGMILQPTDTFQKAAQKIVLVNRIVAATKNAAANNADVAQIQAAIAALPTYQSPDVKQILPGVTGGLKK